MSLQAPSRRLTRSALLTVLKPATTTAQNPPHHHHHLLLLLPPQKRTLFGFGRKNPKTPPKTADAMLDEFLKRAPSTSAPKPSPVMERGSLSSGSIFESDDPTAGKEHLPLPEDGRSAAATPLDPSLRDPATMAMALDPMPEQRKRWERKMVIRQITHRGRLGRVAALKRSERESVSKSPLLKTSVKKLVKLARQIQGKPMEEAKLQLRFSPKKVAGDVLTHLKYAESEAVVRRGMGLGAVGMSEEERREREVMIRLKDNKKHLVKEPTGMYVSQAWVGRGPFGYDLDHRARGQINRLKPPYTSITVLLKEEKTRIREYEEREAKVRKRDVWVHLPNRPVTQQRQFPLW